MWSDNSRRLDLTLTMAYHIERGRSPSGGDTDETEAATSCRLPAAGVPFTCTIGPGSAVLDSKLCSVSFSVSLQLVISACDDSPSTGSTFFPWK